MRLWKVLRTECSGSGHLGPWSRRVFFRSSTSCGSRALTIRAVRALRGFLMHRSVAASEAREDTYISRNMTGRFWKLRALAAVAASSNLCALTFFLAAKLKSLSIGESLAVHDPFSGSFFDPLISTMDVGNVPRFASARFPGG